MSGQGPVEIHFRSDVEPPLPLYVLASLSFDAWDRTARILLQKEGERWSVRERWAGQRVSLWRNQAVFGVTIANSSYASDETECAYADALAWAKGFTSTRSFKNRAEYVAFRVQTSELAGALARVAQAREDSMPVEAVEAELTRRGIDTKPAFERVRRALRQRLV